jgi:paired small multidrug resistance pump
VLVWTERKLAALLCHGRIKAWEILFNSDLSGFFCFLKLLMEVSVMNANWMKVFVGAFFEVFWVIGLKHANGFWSWTGTVISIIVSFSLIIMAGRKLPVGSVYAVFVGLGTAGTVIAEIIFFGETIKVEKIMMILLLLVGVLGLKLLTNDDTQKGAES